jgi:RimJ/RimL family protein N-acetyltransferase/ADP-ribose pyrophosphatase YjhB (NUDIX family)
MPRVQAIVVRDDRILMVKHRQDGEEYWCLPGGALEAGESPEQGALRELREECQVDGEIVRQTAHVSYAPDDETYSFLVDIGDGNPSLGHDPEVDEGQQELLLVDVQWLRLSEIPERDRAFLWAAGLLGAADFLSEVEGWGNDTSYPGTAHSRPAADGDAQRAAPAHALEPLEHRLRNGHVLLIREAEADDAGAVLEFIHAVCGESDFLSFGPGEFELTEAEEAEVLRQYRSSDNQIYMLGLIDQAIVAALIFSAARRSRIRHSGEFGMSVQKQYWGLGIGSRLLDVLIAWARDTGIIKKINLRVRPDNERALALYEGKGFVREGTIRWDIRIDGEYHDHHWMGLKL